LGLQRATGIELSLSGEIVSHLNVTAAALLGEVRIIGPNLAAEGVGEIAFGQPRSQFVIYAEYKIPKWPAFSADIALAHDSSVPASVNDAVQVQAQTVLNAGARYRFKVLGAPATLRVQLQNATNYNFWFVASSPGFSQFSPRSLFGYLTVDI
jgi:iron complex outermembrane recepter protein